jgi:integrase
MNEKYYIRSNKYSTQERPTKRGRVYDIAFRVVTHEGKEKQKKLSGFKTKGAAREAYLEFVQEHCELAKGNVIKQLTAPMPDSDITIEQLIEVYIASLNNQNKDSSIYDKRNVFRLFIVPQLGKVKLHELTKELLYKWQDELWATKNPKTNDYYSYKYLSKIRGFFLTFLSWCCERYQTVNYLASIKQPKRRVPKSEMQFWTRAEFEQFIEVVGDPVYRTLFSMLFFTGRRKGEILALTPEDIKLDKHSIVFTKSLSRKTLTDRPYVITSTKNEKHAATPICNTLMNELRSYSPPDGPFYFGGEQPLAENTIRRAFNNYAIQANVKQIRIHDLRHSFVSLLIHLGANLTVVADLIGDTLEQVTKTYAHLYIEDKLKIIEKIG